MLCGSIMYKMKLPMVLAFNKTDVVSHETCMKWMVDCDAFQVQNLNTFTLNYTCQHKHSTHINTHLSTYATQISAQTMHTSEHRNSGYKNSAMMAPVPETQDIMYLRM